MKNLLVLSMATLFAMSAFAQDGPKIKFEKETYDFGEIDKGEKVSTIFKFSNVGNAQLEIKDVATSCGCTTAKLQKTKYEPGETGEIPVTFNSDRFGGPITKRVTVTTNDSNSPKTVVTIKGQVIVDIVAKPANVYFKAPTSTKTSQEITITSNKLPKLEISDLKIEPDFLEVSQRRENDKNIVITLVADGSKFPKGKSRLNGYMTYKTNSSTQKDMRSAITISVERPIQFNPKSVYFYASRAGKERSMNVDLTSTQGKEFNLGDLIANLEFTNESGEKINSSDYVKVSVTRDEGLKKALNVTLKDNAPLGKFQGNISIKTNMDGEEELIIPIRGSVIK